MSHSSYSRLIDIPLGQSLFQAKIPDAKKWYRCKRSKKRPSAFVVTMRYLKVSTEVKETP